MIKGQKVKCLNNYNGLGYAINEIYDVTAGEGDTCGVFGDVLDSMEFNIVDNDGDTRYEYILQSDGDGNDIWEIVE